MTTDGTEQASGASPDLTEGRRLLAEATPGPMDLAESGPYCLERREDAEAVAWLYNNADALLALAGRAASAEREVERLRARLRAADATLLRLETALEEALERSAWEQAEAARGERDADMGQGSGGTQDMARNRFRLPQDGPDGPQTASDGTAALRGQNSAETAVRR